MKNFLQLIQIIGFCLIVITPTFYEQIGKFSFILIGAGIYFLFKTERLKSDLKK